MVVVVVVAVVVVVVVVIQSMPIRGKLPPVSTNSSRAQPCLKNLVCPSSLPASLTSLLSLHECQCHIFLQRKQLNDMNTPDVQFRSQLQVTRQTKIVGVGHPNLNFWGVHRPDTQDTYSGGGSSSGCGSVRGSCGSR